MTEFTLQEIRQAYDEYKDALDRIAQGDYDLINPDTNKPYTIQQIEMMHEIVKELEDQGFHLIVRPIS